MTQDQWYTNKDLYEMVQGLHSEIAALKTDLAETATLIRDYNGLRQKINECEQLLHETQGKAAGGRDVYGYVVGAIGILMALISFAVK